MPSSLNQTMQVLELLGLTNLVYSFFLFAL